MNDNNFDISLSGAPNDKYEKFFQKFNEINNLPIDKWNTTHLIGYFCKKYKEFYKTDYKFKFNNPAPSKSFEVFQIKRLAANLTSNPELLKDYIDWVFINKVSKAKRKLTSISFLTNEETVNFYKLNVLMSNTSISRTTILPDKYKNLIKDICNYPVNTYGDLAFLSQMPDMPFEVIGLFLKLEEIGFDKIILTKIK